MKTLLSSLIAAGIGALMMLASAQANDLEKVKQSGELRIGMSGVFPPFSFVDGQNQVVGFDVDIGTEIAKRLGVKPVVVTTAFDGIIAGLRAGKFDVVVGSMSITPGADLMASPPPTHLPVDPAEALLAEGLAPADVVRRLPSSPLAWATAGESASGTTTCGSRGSGARGR